MIGVDAYPNSIYKTGMLILEEGRKKNSQLVVY